MLQKKSDKLWCECKCWIRESLKRLKEALDSNTDDEESTRLRCLKKEIRLNLIAMPIFMCLFVHVCLLIDEQSLILRQSIDRLLERKTFQVSPIRKLRRMFCSIQKQISEANAIFTEICFLWILKIVFRCCMSAYDLLRDPWSDDNSSVKCVVLLDTVFDVSYLLILSIYAGRVSESKTEILNSLICLGRVSPSHVKGEDCFEDIHFFVTIVGNSNGTMTLWNIMPLRKSLAINLLGIIGSYSVIIYQLSYRE
ncbi:uncharacterized protein NPIL_181911 [Nephila pilipes]|uniref:Uncharacterized protein n=1 Tax=Nephila pilipes TaxID=299642 RepID=A0A8X6NBL0_NEPPI|nr:uncharacterized protein NPIL_181911 [Nephila pilipes]